MENKPQLKISIDQTTEVTCSNPECDGKIFNEGLMFRRVSKFLSGTGKDALVPINLAFCIKCQTPLAETVPTNV
jgi:hypothetical protein